MQHGKPVSNLLEVADLHQSRPKLNRSPDDCNRIIHDAKKVVLKKIRFKTIECLFEIGCEQPQSIDAVLTFSRPRRKECTAVKAGNLFQNFFCILRGNLSRIVKGDT